MGLPSGPLHVAQGPSQHGAWWPQGSQIFMRSLKSPKASAPSLSDLESEVGQRHLSCSLLAEPVPSPSRAHSFGSSAKDSSERSERHFMQTRHGVVSRIVGGTPWQPLFKWMSDIPPLVLLFLFE